MTEAMTLFKEAVRGFWLRDWRADVELLDRALARSGAPGAGLVCEPPSLLTGDPFQIAIGEGLLVLGLNPKWQGDDATFQRCDAGPARAAREREDFSVYCAQRAAYFDPDSRASYGRYFTRLGAALAAGFFDTSVPSRNAAADARRFLRHHVAKLDLLPWWSARTAAIDDARVTVALEPIAAWAEIIRLAADTLRPRAIVVNGSGWRRLVGEVFDIDLSLRTVKAASDKLISAYFGRYGDTPVLVHAQLNSRSGPGHDAYRTLAGAALADAA